MNERNWRKIGSSKLTKSDIMVAGVFSTRNEACLSKIYFVISWKERKLTKEILIVKNISPGFIGGIDMMKECGVFLAEINMIDASDVGKKHDDLERIHRALKGVSDPKNARLKS